MEFTVLNKRLGIVTVKISDEDADLALVRWHLAGGKVQSGQAGKYLRDADIRYLHRVVAQRMGLIAEVKSGEKRGHWEHSIDHINGNKMDNRRENLRLGDRRRQMTNLNDGLRTTNKSGFRGVCYSPNQGGERKWHAYATVNYKSISLGYYLTRDEAIAARQGWDTARSISA